MGSKESLDFTKFEIFSNEGFGSVDLRAASPRIEYRESVLCPFVTVTCAIVDTGNSFASNDGTNKTISLLEAIKCQGTEKVFFEIQDATPERNKISFVKDTNCLKVATTSNIKQSFKNTSFILTMVPTEASENTFLENRCRIPYNAKISDIVQNIIKNNLKSVKKIDFDITQDTINREGKDKYPFEMILDIQKLSIPDIAKSKGKMAGYLFWETSKGYHFKSLDKLFDTTGKTIKRYIENKKVGNDLPPGFDDKILFSSIDRTTDSLSQFYAGTFGVVMETWDPITNTYAKNQPFTASEKGNGIIAGKYLPRVNPDFLDRDGKPKATARLSNKSKPKAHSIYGDSINQQVQKTNQENYPIDDILRQSLQNYRQKFNMSMEIIIPSDFSLHAGDIIYCEFPELSTKSTIKRSDRDSGIYMISDLCHFGNRSKTFTGLHLVRDSYGVKNG